MKLDYTAHKDLSVDHSKQDAIRAKNRATVKPPKLVSLNGFIKFAIIVLVICLIKSIIF